MAKRDLSQTGCAFALTQSSDLKRGLRPKAAYNEMKRCLTITIPAFQVFFHPIWQTCIRLTNDQWKEIKLTLWAILIVWNVGGLAVGYPLYTCLASSLPYLSACPPTASTFIQWVVVILVLLGYAALYAGNATLIAALLFGYLVKEHLIFHQGKLTLAITIAGIKVRQRSFFLSHITGVRWVKKPEKDQGLFRFEHNGEKVEFGYGNYETDTPAMARHFRQVITYGCHKVERILFCQFTTTALDISTDICNPDLYDLTFPLFALKQVIIDAGTCDVSLVNRFLDHADRFKDFYHSKNGRGEIYIYGNAGRIPPGLLKKLEHTFKIIRCDLSESNPI